MSQLSTSCWACGRAETTEVDAYRPLGLRRCPSCGLVFRADSLATDLVPLYDLDYFRDNDYFRGNDLDEASTAARGRFEAEVRLRLLRPWLARGRVLEIGTAAGYFLDALRRSGYEPLGVDISAEIAEAAARHFDIDVLVGAVADVQLEPSSFDAACAWHVVEHIPDPLRSLECVHAALRPGGLLFLEVPNFGGLRSRRQGAAWPLLQPRYHVGQFAPQSLATLLRRARFVVETMETVPFAAYRRPLRALMSHAKYAALARTWPIGTHPNKHELLRAVARRPS